MAVWGIDFYGQSKYGSSSSAEFDVQPFIAEAEGYNALRLTWTYPTGEWRKVALVKSRSGYPVAVNDGDRILEFTSGNPATYYRDADLDGSTFYYYVLFIQKTDGVWVGAAATSGLSLADTGLSTLIWNRIPKYFRYTRRDGAAVTDDYYFSTDVEDLSRYDVENQHLRRFVDVVGWGLEYLKAYQGSLMYSQDPQKTHVENLERLAEQFGIPFERTVNYGTVRSRIGNGALLSRRRGTLEGLRDVVSLSTGWDIDLRPGNNLMLNDDQAEFANPTWPEWDSAVNYAVGQQVQYVGRIYTCIVGALGDAKQPPAHPTTSNTWWELYADEEYTSSWMPNPTSGAIFTWKGATDLGAHHPLSLAVGVSDYQNSGMDEGASNALKIETASTMNVSVWGAAAEADATVPNPLQVITQGIPLPQPNVWRKDVDYRIGDYVNQGGTIYRATEYSTNKRPSSSPGHWERVGVDLRPKVAYSFYGHGPREGTAGTGGVAVVPGVQIYDDKGSLMQSVVDVAGAEVVYDTFNTGLPDFGSRTPDFTISGTNWTADSGVWSIYDVGNERLAYPSTTAATTTLDVPIALTDYRIAVTFRAAPLETQQQGLVVHYVDEDNFVLVHRTGITKRTAGVDAPLGVEVAAGPEYRYNLWDPIEDGDRLMITIDEDTNSITEIKINGEAQNVTGTGSDLLTLLTGYLHSGSNKSGMMVL